MIDWDGLTIGPLMDIHGRPITVTPLASQPGQPAYDARGDFRIENIDMPLEDGILSTQVLTLGIRKNDFTVPPNVGDTITIPDGGIGLGILVCTIDDTDDDAQGHSIYTLKRIEQ